MPEPLTPARFVAKWKPVELSERAASQSHFNDLCELLGQPNPTDHDATGAEYTFEKGVTPTAGASRGAAGDRGFADVWWRGKFGWEYKRKGKYRDLNEAYRQLCQYREALENPPLLIVSDIARTEIHTNFTGTVKQVHAIALDDMAEPRSLDLLRRVFTDPESFKPDVTAARITEDVAKQFGSLAQSLRSREHDAHAAAHFLMKCMFCLFAEDVSLLPGNLFTRLVEANRKDPAKLTDRLTELFATMRTGGDFGVETVAHFNGGLFDGSPALRLTAADIDTLLAASRLDWGAVEPAIFGTLFERSLDPNTRAQIGAHYTSRDDIMLVVEPVVMAPLRREWEAVKADVETQLERRRKVKTKKTKGKAEKDVGQLLQDFVHRLATVRILDPACGSGNFLYVAIQQLLHLEKEVITYAARPDIALGLFPQVRPTQLHGIEINPYAAELAQVVIWIGYLQWMRDNGFAAPRNPILEPLQTIECRDAILDLSDPKHPKPASWPDADFIIGNPPFLGGNLIRQGLGDEYVEAMFSSFDLPNFSDLCCYWFESRKAIDRSRNVRAGLLATQGIRGGVNRTVLEKIRESGNIFYAWSDRNWILDGAAVHVAIVGFAHDEAEACLLNNRIVAAINSDLTSGLDLTRAIQLPENEGIQFEGDKKGGEFELSFHAAHAILQAPLVCEDSVLSVCRPWFNGSEVNGRLEGNWIIDFPPCTGLEQAARYPEPFRIVTEKVGAKYSTKRHEWWIHERPRPAMRAALALLDRFPVTTRHAKYRMFTWVHGGYLPDSAVIAFARPDDYFFGVLHNSIHELWALRMGTQLEDRPRYTPTTCFETFPLPWPPGTEPREPALYAQRQGSGSGTNPPVSPLDKGGGKRGEPPLADARGSDKRVARTEVRGSQANASDIAIYDRIAEAARQLNEQRERWLNPPEWIGPIAEAVDDEDDFADVPVEARGLIRQSAIMARAAKDAKLKKRTLTNLYNERPTWLRLAHEQLDRAVLAAYAATDPDGDWSEDWSRVWVETGAGQSLPNGHELTELRKETDQRVLANLLRMNLERAGGESS